MHIELVPVWSHIKSLRHFVRDFCLGVGLPAATADQVAMTTSELLENATKYAATPRLRYELRVCDGHVEVSVANRASARQRSTLRCFLDEVTRGEPLEAYLRCLERQGDSGVSQSGLARIRYEAGATLSTTEKGDEVTVLARVPR